MATENKKTRNCLEKVYRPLSPMEGLINYLNEAYKRNGWDWSVLETACREVDERLCSFDYYIMGQVFHALTSGCRAKEVELYVAEVMLTRLYLHRITSTSLNLRPLFLSLTLWFEKLLSFGYLLLMPYGPADPEHCRHRLERNLYQKVGAFWQTVFFHQSWGDETLPEDTVIKQRCCRRYAGPLFDHTFDAVTNFEEQRWLSLKKDIAALVQVLPSQEVAQIDVSATRLRSAMFMAILESCEQLIMDLD
ncbi:MAG: hypothetical protein ACI3ZY_00215 [Parabacteroides sp.]